MNDLDFENAIAFLDDDTSDDVTRMLHAIFVAHQPLSIIMNECYRTNLISMIPELSDGGSFMKLLNKISFMQKITYLLIIFTHTQTLYILLKA